MGVKLILLCSWFLLWTSVSSATRSQGPAGEVVKRPATAPVVDEKAAARAEAAARMRRNAAIADQFELALKRGNEAVDTASAHPPTISEYLSKAESEYQRAAKLKPGDWRVYSGLGRLYVLKSTYGDAAVAYQRAISLRPGDAELYFRQGEANAMGNKNAEAIRALERSIKLDPSPKNSVAFYRLVRAYDDEKLFDKEIATYKQILTTLPNGGPDDLKNTYFELGDACIRAKRYSDAIA